MRQLTCRAEGRGLQEAEDNCRSLGPMKLGLMMTALPGRMSRQRCPTALRQIELQKRFFGYKAASQ